MDPNFRTEIPAVREANDYLCQITENGHVPGMSVTALFQGHMVVHKGYGYADLKEKRPVDPNATYFRTASVSKPIAATALLKMVEEGLIELDASLYDYVPYFPKKAYDFTIGQLAGHMAGIRGYRGKEFALNKAYTIRESLTLFQDDPLLFRPGTGYLYNSFDWVLISLAMEEVAGIPFADYVFNKVLVPLNMDRTIPERKGGEPLDTACFYSPWRSGFRKAIPVNNEYKLAAGGYLSTTGDIAKLGQAYLEGKIGDASLISLFLSSGRIDNKPTYYGLGWEVSKDRKGRPFYGHTGNSVGAFSKFMVYPESGLVLVVFVNCTNPGMDKVMRKITDLLLDGLPGYLSINGGSGMC